MTEAENYRRAARFENPEWIPVFFHVNPACWHHYDREWLADCMEARPFLFPDFDRKLDSAPAYLPNQIAAMPYRDPWGCVWETHDDGITGAVTGHPLADWSQLDALPAPDPDRCDGVYAVDWRALDEQCARKRAAGRTVTGGLPHGHTFLRLQDLRGYENLMLDLADEEPLLDTLLERVVDFNIGVIERWVALQPDVVAFPEDLGMQSGPMLSPADFRRRFLPAYQRIMAPAAEAGCIVHMHSDGDLHLLIDDLLDSPIDVLNLQDLVNGVDWIAQRLAGRVCVDLDIDRQSVTARGTPETIDELIRSEVSSIGRREGGLMLVYGLYPGVPVENAEAVMDAIERYARWFA